MKIDRAATDGAFGRLATTLGVEPGRAAFGVHDVVNENMAGAARVAIAERGRIPAEYALLATGGAGPVHAWHVARKLGINRVVCPPGRGGGQHHRHADGAGARRSRGELQRGAGRRRLRRGDARLRRSGEGGGRRPASHRRGHRASHRPAPGRHALYRPGQRDHGGAAGPDHRGRGESGVRSGLQGAVRPHAAGGRHPVRRPAPVGQRADGRAAAARWSCRAIPSAAALKGTRPVFFPDAGKTLPTRSGTATPSNPACTIDGPAVFEEDESTFIVGPGAKARLLADGSILAEVG